MDYPKYKPHISGEELREHFSLSFNDRELLVGLGGEAAVLGFAILLKSFQFLVYVPHDKAIIPQNVIEWISTQLGVRESLFRQYNWWDRSWNRHLAAIRKYTGFRPCQSDDYSKISTSLLEHGNELPTRKKWCEAAAERFREIRIELPVEKKFRRLVNSRAIRFSFGSRGCIAQKSSLSRHNMISFVLSLSRAC